MEKEVEGERDLVEDFPKLRKGNRIVAINKDTVLWKGKSELY